tara:strand:- start:5090 stop:7504 length:2415 start_codon:yes stop_codon:yes gene_type:complete
MAEPRRRWFSKRNRASQENVDALNAVLNTATAGNENTKWDSGLHWDGKSLASMSRIGNATKSGASIGGTRPTVSYDLLRDISLKSEVVNAILRRTVDDTLGNGYEFVLPDGKEEGDKAQLAKLKSFFRNPNPDDNGDEWLESLVYDLTLFGDAYLELDGSKDRATNTDQTNWLYGGELISIWNIPAETMLLTAGNRRPEPPAMAYVQKLDGQERQFSSEKVLHVSKFKHGRAYGTSPLIPLLNVISGHLNLSNYLNELYTGTLPKTILNVGDISNGEMKAMLSLLEQQLSGGKSPFGLVAVNGGTGFNMHRILDSTREGAQLELIQYYREEICAVFGIPPMKLGWVQSGKMANPEQQLDAWYDVIESYHNRIESLINNRILPLLSITDYEFKFLSIRPSRAEQEAKTKKEAATAISNLRQEGIISINEARSMVGLERIPEEKADDPFYLSPKLAINKGKVDGGVSDEDSGESPTTSPSLSDIFPNPDSPADEGKDIGNIPDFTEEVPHIELNNEVRGNLSNRRMKNDDEYNNLISSSSVELDAEFASGQDWFSSEIIKTLDSRFSDGDEAIAIDGIDLDNVRSYRRKAAISLDDVRSAVVDIDTIIANTVQRQNIAATGLLTDSYGASMELTLGGTGISAALQADDIAAMSYWRQRWVLPALRRTLGAHRTNILGVFGEMLTNGQSWKWAKTEMRSLIDPSGSRYPAYYYDRIARTETRRVVENSHLYGLRRANFVKVERLVVIDDRTDKDTCAPYEGAIYGIERARSVIPAHPNCRCTFVAYEGDTPSIPAGEILRPDIEGAE